MKWEAAFNFSQKLIKWPATTAAKVIVRVNVLSVKARTQHDSIIKKQFKILHL